MEELEEKIRAFSRFRIEYFLRQPSSSLAQFEYEIRARIVELQQVGYCIYYCMHMHMSCQFAANTAFGAKRRVYCLYKRPHPQFESELRCERC